MIFRVEINTENAAFQDEGPVMEVCRILQKVAADLELGRSFDPSRTLRDINGNAVGYASYKDESEEGG